MDKKGGSLIWTPSYTPNLEPIELFWTFGETSVGIDSDIDSESSEVYGSIRQGWYGENDWPFQEGGRRRQRNVKVVQATLLSR